ncbi:hypothetical protein [Paenibacillus xerothermodurans]|uniref:Uncharacterized protein n=1 Tax=Paenibacillus xerothermodurans TaxID=1977292 RepID=A0A2W1NSE1_PAEXE|nr:hypothetical protein [Paenibacillus xerothermodurans]PZE20666.1 hypothetical protein CBW46_010840 [Paenibacillus xerothermodurans]
MFHRDSVVQLWRLSALSDAHAPEVVGRLPKGEWLFRGRSGYGHIGDVFVAFHLMNDFTHVEEEDRIAVTSAIASN